MRTLIFSLIAALAITVTAGLAWAQDDTDETTSAVLELSPRDGVDHDFYMATAGRLFRL